MTAPVHGRGRSDLLDGLANFAAEQRISLRDPQAVPRFASWLNITLNEALSDPIRLYGQRAQAMFEAMVVSFGEFSLLKVEDAGRMYPETGFRVPDFRIVLQDGTQWVIEVKNVYKKDPSLQSRRLMTRAYRQELENYASSTGAQLKLAVFWARWGIWTLVSPEQFVDRNGDVAIEMKDSLMRNELGRLGDRTIGTRPPLRLCFTADPAKTSSIASNGEVEFTIGNVQMYCDQLQIVDPIERQIAWMFMLYGEWEEAEPEPLVEGSRLKGIEFRWEPRSRNNVGFETIGSLSRIFSRYYAEKTLEERDIVQLFARSRPEWFQAILTGDYKGKALPLWILVQET